MANALAVADTQAPEVGNENEENDASVSTIVLPEGYTEDTFLAEMRERYQEASDYDRLNREAALQDLEFFAGDQWDDDAKQARVGRPMLTINVLPQSVAQVVGDIRINKPGIKVRPAKDATKELAETREGLIRSIERDSQAQQVYAIAGQSQVACGIGFFRIALEYAADDVFDQDIKIKAIQNPLSVVVDPMSVEPTAKDAGYMFVTDELPKKVFEKAYPDATPSDLGSLETSHSMDGWYSAETVRVTEYWCMKETKVVIALMQDGSVQQVTDAAPQGVAMGADGKPRMRDSKRLSAVRYLVTGKDILEGPYELPISRLPIFRVEGWTCWVGERRERWGLVRFAKDPQRYKNYWRSASAEAIALGTKGKWVAPADAVEGYEQDWREAHLSSDPLLKYKSGAQPPQWIAPPPVPVALLNEASLSAQDIKDVTGLHDASLGAQSNETSGVAIRARESQGDVATYTYHDNLHASIEQCGIVANELIPVAYDSARIIMVLGEDGTSTPQPVNDPANPEAVDLSIGKYSIAVEAGPSYSTKRVEASDSMTAFIQAFPAAAPLIGDLYAKMQDWPMAEEVGDRLKAMLPPQIQNMGPDGKPLPQQPPPPDPAQQAMQQGEMAKTQAEVRKSNALADKAEADAKLSNANAGLAQYELDLVTGQLHDHIAEAVGHHTATALVNAGVRVVRPPQAPPPPGGPLPPGAPGAPMPPGAPPAPEAMHFGQQPPPADPPPQGQEPPAP